MLLLNTTSIQGLHIARIKPADFRLWFWFHLNRRRHGNHCGLLQIWLSWAHGTHDKAAPVTHRWMMWLCWILSFYLPRVHL